MLTKKYIRVSIVATIAILISIVLVDGIMNSKLMEISNIVKKHKQQKYDKAHGGHIISETLQLYSLEPIIIQLNDGRRLKLGLVFKYNNRSHLDLLITSAPIIKDIIYRSVANYGRTICTIKTKDMIKSSIIKNINNRAGETVLLDVYFSEFIF